MSRERLQQLRQATREAACQMADNAKRFGKVITPVVVAFQLFQTPAQLADLMAEMLDPQPGQEILEPSAGLGRLYRAVRQRCDNPITLVEIAPQCAETLYRETATDPNCQLLQGDFLTRELPQFDLIIMNPPFKQGADIRHAKRAMQLLKPRGRIVGLCYNGVRQNAELRPIVETWQVLPESTFKESGTTASVVLWTFTNGTNPSTH